MLKDALVSRQEEARMEREKLQMFGQELSDRERLLTQLMRQQSLSTTSTSNEFAGEFARALKVLNQKTNDNRESNDSSDSFQWPHVAKSGTFSGQLKESKNCSDSSDPQKSLGLIPRQLQKNGTTTS